MAEVDGSPCNILPPRPDLFGFLRIDIAGMFASAHTALSLISSSGNASACDDRPRGTFNGG